MALDSLSRAGCQTVYIDGSFVTDKEVPNDFDACWEETGVAPELLDPVLLRFDAGRAAQKARYLGELFPASIGATADGMSFREFFQTDRETGRAEGHRRRGFGRPRMIKNERQYRITRTQAQRFAQTLRGLRERPEAVDGVHPIIAQAQVDAVSSQLADLEAELREYESVRAGEFRMDTLRVVADLPALLIKARISQGLSQKELADRLGLKEQQIQRYEATDYATAKWSRIREVASAFGIDLSNPAPPVVSR